MRFDFWGEDGMIDHKAQDTSTGLLGEVSWHA